MASLLPCTAKGLLLPVPGLLPSFPRVFILYLSISLPWSPEPPTTIFTNRPRIRTSESTKLVEDFHGCRLAKETLPVHAIYPGHEARILTCFQGQLLPTAANRSGLPEMCGSSSHFWIPCRRNISLFQTCSLSGELKGGQLRTFQE